MEQQINIIIIREMENFIEESQQKLALSDEIYLNDSQDEKELEERYESLNLEKSQKMFVNDYIACIKTTGSRYSELSYMAGIRDTVKTLIRFGLINNTAKTVTKNNI